MRETWVHDQTKMPMEDIMKKPNLVKSAATKALKVFLTAGNLKLGKDSFPGWRFCVEKAYFINTSTLLVKLPNVFNCPTSSTGWPWMESPSVTVPEVELLP